MSYLQGLQLFAPELMLFVTACVSLFVSLRTSQKGRYFVKALALIGLILAITVVGYDIYRHVSLSLGDQFVLSQAILWLKLLICVFGLFSVLLLSSVESVILAQFVFLAMMILASTYNLLLMFISLELMSLAFYIMVALRDARLNSEAVIKFCILGLVASGIFVFGISFWYGALHSLSLWPSSNTAALDIPLLVLAFVFILIAMTFKLGLFPLHMWQPDIYFTSSSDAVLLLGSLPKVVSTVVFARIILAIPSSAVVFYRPMLIALILVSMFYGIFVALIQADVKRMLGYAAIAQMGFVLLCLIIPTAIGYQTALFYVVSYALSFIAVFAIICSVEDLSGLYKRAPWLAFALYLALFSMAGLPPLLGFVAKLSMFQLLINSGFGWLALIAIIVSLIAVYPYIRVVKQTCQPSVSNSSLSIGKVKTLLVSLPAILLLIWGCLPQSLLQFCLMLGSH